MVGHTYINRMNSAPEKEVLLEKLVIWENFPIVFENN